MIAPAADAQGRWGSLDHFGQWLAPPSLEYAGAFDDARLSPFKHAGLWGYADASGNHRVPARFTQAAPCHHGLAMVRTDQGAAYADTTGTIVIAGPFAAAGPFGPVGLGSVRLQSTGLCGYVDRHGRLAVPARFDGTHPCGARYGWGDLWGLVDTAGHSSWTPPAA
ncbi:WG repeat-containing protein [Streptomyces sp. NPDC059851]|uniref:WG repeat-containing protein n=1 Tax=Streptomyces sp. NPDC059851 TaxID=3346971 RepID=UPI003648C2A4